MLVLPIRIPGASAAAVIRSDDAGTFAWGKEVSYGSQEEVKNPEVLSKGDTGGVSGGRRNDKLLRL